MKTNKKIITYQQLRKIRNKYYEKKIVLITGFFDLLHLGHIKQLDYCKSKGDILVVAIGDDETIKKMKGKKRPIYNEIIRTKMVAALEAVNYVCITDEFIPGRIINNKFFKLLKPNIYIVPTSDPKNKEKRKLAEKYNAQFISCHRTPPAEFKNGISTTKIISLIIKNK